MLKYRYTHVTISEYNGTHADTEATGLMETIYIAILC